MKSRLATTASRRSETPIDLLEDGSRLTTLGPDPSRRSGLRDRREAGCVRRLRDRRGGRRAPPRVSRDDRTTKTIVDREPLADLQPLKDNT